jgi:hypothetical protein
MSPEQKHAEDRERWRAFLTRYGARLGEESEGARATRRRRMDAENPVFILRNWIAQDAIKVRKICFEARGPDRVGESVGVLHKGNTGCCRHGLCMISGEGE